VPVRSLRPFLASRIRVRARAEVNEIDHTYWYLTRATGLVSYLLLFSSVTLGLLLTGDLMSRWLQRYRIYDVHRFLALPLGLTTVHAFIVLPDRY
jgi:succinate dehydrogenase hydrophobic anchor subunit